MNECAFDIGSREHAVCEPFCDFNSFCKPILLLRCTEFPSVQVRKNSFLVLWIRDILIRNRIRGSEPLTYGLRIRIVLFSSVNFKMPTCAKLFKGTFTSVWVMKKSQNSRNWCFSYYFCCMMEESGSGSLLNLSGTSPCPCLPRFISFLTVIWLFHYCAGAIRIALKAGSIFLMWKLACDLQAGEYGRICPNTGVSRYELSVDTEGKLTAAACSQLHFKAVLLIRITSSGITLLSFLNVSDIFIKMLKVS